MYKECCYFEFSLCFLLSLSLSLSLSLVCKGSIKPMSLFSLVIRCDQYCQSFHNHNLLHGIRGRGLRTSTANERFPKTKPNTWQRTKNKVRMDRGMASLLPTEKLDRSNYAPWLYKMHQYLLWHGQWSYFDGVSDTTPDAAHKGFSTVENMSLQWEEESTVRKAECRRVENSDSTIIIMVIIMMMLGNRSLRMGRERSQVDEGLGRGRNQNRVYSQLRRLYL